MAELKLPKLPDRTPVRLTISVPPDLKTELDAYADAYEKAYGHREPIAELVPAMLSNFLESDRIFQRQRKDS